MSDLETSINRDNTVAFIAERPSRIDLIPQNKVDKLSGGYEWVDQPPRGIQILRIIELGTQTTPPILQLTDGKQREAEFWLLGEHDARIEVNDHWTADDGREWLVGEVLRHNGYEVRALVTERGR